MRRTVAVFTQGKSSTDLRKLSRSRPEETPILFLNFLKLQQHLAFAQVPQPLNFLDPDGKLGEHEQVAPKAREEGEPRPNRQEGCPDLTSEPRDLAQTSRFLELERLLLPECRSGTSRSVLREISFHVRWVGVRFQCAIHNVVNSIDPHPAFGHPLPWGEGRGGEGTAATGRHPCKFTMPTSPVSSFELRHSQFVLRTFHQLNLCSNSSPTFQTFPAPMVITRSPAFNSGSKTVAISERLATCRAFLWPCVLIASTKRSELIPSIGSSPAG